MLPNQTYRVEPLWIREQLKVAHTDNAHAPAYLVIWEVFIQAVGLIGVTFDDCMVSF